MLYVIVYSVSKILLFLRILQQNVMSKSNIAGVGISMMTSSVQKMQYQFLNVFDFLQNNFTLTAFTTLTISVTNAGRIYKGNTEMFVNMTFRHT